MGATNTSCPTPCYRRSNSQPLLAVRVTSVSTPSRYVSEYSRHPDPAIALGEALGGVVERIGPSPDLAVVFVSGAAALALPQIVDAIHTLLCPTVLIGAAGQAIISGAELNSGSGVAIWAGNPGTVRPVYAAGGCQLPQSHGGEVFIGLTAAKPDTHAAGVHHQLWLDDAGYHEGQVGISLAKERVSVARAKGFRPVGEPLAVTGISNGQISHLAAETASVTMKGVIAGLTPAERSLASTELAIGVVRDEYLEDFGPGDFSIVQLRGTNPSGSLLLQENDQTSPKVALGSIVQFHVADQALASFDPADLTSKGRGDYGALIVATAGQALPDTTNFQDLGIGATSGLVTASDVLLGPELSSPGHGAQSSVGKARGPAVVLFH